MIIAIENKVASLLTFWSYLILILILLSSIISYREAGAGVNRLSYFLAVNIAQLPHIFLMPIMYLSLQYTFTAPRGNSI